MARNAVKEDEISNVSSKKETLKKLLKYLKPYKLKVFIVILLLIFVMMCGLVNPYLLKNAIDIQIANSNVNGLIIIAVVLCFLNFLSMIASKKRIVIMSSITNNILLTIRNELYSHIQKLSFSFFDNRPAGKILARVMGDVNALQELFSNSITTLIPDTLSLICVTIVMFSMNYKLALSAIIILPLLFVSLFSIEKFATKRWMNYRKKRSNLNAFTHEDFSGIRVIQCFAKEKDTSETFLSLVNDMVNSFVSSVRLNDFFWPLVELSWGIGSIVVYWVGAGLITKGDISVGTLIAFTLYITMFWKPIMNISDFYNTLITNFAAAERIFEIMSIDPYIISGKSAIKMPKIKGHVEFKNVTFAYDDDDAVIHDINFKIKPGESIALVGPTGAGKTTIVNLISRFYDTTKGDIFIDNLNVKNVELYSLRSQMGIMLQDTFLFSASIKENIRYGKLNATDNEIIAAAKAVSAHDFIMKLENGYDTEVNERGSRLSVGQRQLISFARALLANPRILILDEATSNIDTYTESLVQTGINKLLNGRTSFVIAHRLSTIRDCDKIMVIDDGKICECGNHEELIQLKGKYYDLFIAQYNFLKEGA
ncbi:ABC transporter ATP-binding protein [Clostridium frigidicarnis]|uniref:ATP-binding cassette, subfamily B n=1 Tax=Clostridium frigidicarnis TaxID=84698 RepID=A0A1I0YME9_9CLOT|nr:ABC transporter ATP-binding protein [Clostridium frigidicarnis]SFB14575.1 ATP-binding cassette, subfamily B [Clostridium frigidicarnis]